MNSPDPNQRDAHWSDEWLAGYADGELDPATRDHVDRRLAYDASATDAVRGQETLSQANRRFWDDAEPPRPSDAAWNRALARVRVGLERAVQPLPTPSQSRRVAGWVTAASGLVAVAAAVGWVVGTPVTPAGGGVAHVHTSPPAADAPAPLFDPVESLAVLPVASFADVEIEGVQGDDAFCLPVGNPPLSGGIKLARPTDVILNAVPPDPAWPTGEPRMVMSPGDAVVLYAARPR